MRELAQFYQSSHDDCETAIEGRVQSSTKASKGKPAISKAKNIDNRIDYLNKLARGEISGSSSEEIDDDNIDDNTDEDEEVNEDDDLQLEQAEEEEMPETINDGEETSRLAIQNCDWDNMKAQDIL